MKFTPRWIAFIITTIFTSLGASGLIGNTGTGSSQVDGIFAFFLIVGLIGLLSTLLVSINEN